MTASFKDEGDSILLLGKTKEELGASEYLALIHGRRQGRPPRADLANERALQKLMLAAFSAGLLKSAHDCSEGGLAVALAESCILEPERLLGARVRIPPEASALRIREDALLFGETSGRIVVSCSSGSVEPLLQLSTRYGISAWVIGRVGGSRLEINASIDSPVEELSDIWHTALSRALDK
ncbi:MAG: hypothetical protein HYY57_06485 [Candidatus Omnitrophica bacterium]|nr:hypothetical protein [Candidatus Omnitrophota bacterium]